MPFPQGGQEHRACTRSYGNRERVASALMTLDALRLRGCFSRNAFSGIVWKGIEPEGSSYEERRMRGADFVGVWRVAGSL